MMLHSRVHKILQSFSLLGGTTIGTVIGTAIATAIAIGTAIIIGTANLVGTPSRTVNWSCAMDP